MYILLGYLIFLLAHTFSLITVLCTIPMILFSFVIKNARFASVLSYLVVYFFLDIAWYYFYNKHLGLLLLLLIGLNNFRGQLSGQLYGDALKVIHGETIVVGLFALFTLYYGVFSWV